MTNMETLFIGYPPCSTCKKAYKALLDLGIEATYRNIKEENPTKEEIAATVSVAGFQDCNVRVPAGQIVYLKK